MANLCVQSWKGRTVLVPKALLVVCADPEPSEQCAGALRLVEDHLDRISAPTDGRVSTTTRQFQPSAEPVKPLLKRKRSWDKGVAEQVYPKVEQPKCEMNWHAEFNHLGNIAIGKEITHCWLGATLKKQRVAVILACDPLRNDSLHEIHKSLHQTHHSP